MPQADIGERLRSLPAGSAIALKLDAREYADHYFAFLNATSATSARSRTSTRSTSR